MMLTYTGTTETCVTFDFEYVGIARNRSAHARTNERIHICSYLYRRTLNMIHFYFVRNFVFNVRAWAWAIRWSRRHNIKPSECQPFEVARYTTNTTEKKYEIDAGHTRGWHCKAARKCKQTIFGYNFSSRFRMADGAYSTAPLYVWSRECGTCHVSHSLPIDRTYLLETNSANVFLSIRDRSSK